MSAAPVMCDLCMGSPINEANVNLAFALDMGDGELQYEISVCHQCLCKRERGQRRTMRRVPGDLGRASIAVTSLRPLQRIRKKRR